MTGKIIRQISNQYTVLAENGEKYLVFARGKLRYYPIGASSSFYNSISSKNKKEKKIISLSPKVGDNVLLDLTNDTKLIKEVYSRKNDLIRPDISNIDQVLLVFSAKKPEFSSILLDKFLVMLESYKVKIYILITKIDLIDQKELDSMKKVMKYYDNIGYNVFFDNLKNASKIASLKKIFKGKTTVVSGQTGVGKSTLLNLLKKGINIKTQPISEALGRGKHTTRHTELYEIEDGLVADTPGFSKLDLININDKDLNKLFIEFNNFKCKFNSCLHINEPSCELKKDLEEGKILKSRYENYLYLYNKIKNRKKIF